MGSVYVCKAVTVKKKAASQKLGISQHGVQFHLKNMRQLDGGRAEADLKKKNIICCRWRVSESHVHKKREKKSRMSSNCHLYREEVRRGAQQYLQPSVMVSASGLEWSCQSWWNSAIRFWSTMWKESNKQQLHLSEWQWSKTYCQCS